MENNSDYVSLGLLCAEVCDVLERGLKARQTEPSQHVYDAFERLTTSVK
jgi:hypothetical protein